MKTKTYIRLSLIVPYILWIVFAISLSGFLNLFGDFTWPAILDALTTPIFLYVFGIVLWGIPYSLIAIILGIWSRNQTALKSAKAFAFTPLLLAILVNAQALAIFLFDDSSLPSDLGSMILMLSIFSIIYGYAIIGIVWGTYKLLNRGGYVKGEEIPPMPIE